MENIFIRGQISFQIDNHQVEFSDQNISVFGAAGLPWEGLDSNNHFGREVEVVIQLGDAATPEATIVTLKAKGRIHRETTADGASFGIRLIENASVMDQLSKLIQTQGYFPTEYARKYPRIPFDSHISMFPQRAVFMPSKSVPGLGGPISAEIANLSPNGLMVCTESPMAPALSPGSYVDFFLEPRGSFQHLIRVQGLICRAVDEIDPASGNTVHTFGIQFSRFEDVDKTAFLDLLKAILGCMKS